MGPAAGAQHGTHRAELVGVFLGKNALAHGTLLNGVVAENGGGKLAQLLAHFLHFFVDPGEMLGADVPAHAARDVHGNDDPVARRGFVKVHNPFADLPKLHEHAFKAHAFAEVAHPQKVAVHSVQLRPDDAQVLRARGHFHVHELFQGVTVAQGMDAGADAANALHHVDHLVKVPNGREALQATVHVAEIGYRVFHYFVFHHQGKV